MLTASMNDDRSCCEDGIFYFTFTKTSKWSETDNNLVLPILMTNNQQLHCANNP